MSKFRIEHGASKASFVMLKTNIEDTIAADIDRLAEWSNNDRKYIINELLRFAISQEEEFLKFKARTSGATSQTPRNPRPSTPTTSPATRA